MEEIIATDEVMVDVQNYDQEVADEAAQDPDDECTTTTRNQSVVETGVVPLDSDRRFEEGLR